MFGKWGSLHRIGCENPQKQHSRTYWVQPLRTGFHNIPQIDWACPPRFLVDPEWKMEAGSESQETRFQLLRESRTVEAIYYHNADIPSNPYVAINALDFNDGTTIPVIPLDVVNDESSPDDPSISPGPTVKVGEKTKQLLLERDEVIGTAVALVALIKSKEPGSQIDLELLIQFLHNPGMLDQLMKEHGRLANQSSVITRALPHEHSPVLSPNQGPPAAGPSLSQGVRNVIGQNPTSDKKVDLGKLRKLVNEYGVHLGDDRVNPGPAVVKDADYYRRLISLHGISQENDKPQRSVKPFGSQKQRLCAYFNSPKGCRLGSSCQFQHVRAGLGSGSRAVEKLQGAKKMKLSDGNFARHT